MYGITYSLRDGCTYLQQIRTGCPEGHNQRKSSGDRRRLHDDLSPHPDQRIRVTGVSDPGGPVLACLLLGFDQGPLRQMLFVALLPDGTVVEPRVAKRL